MEKFMLGRKAGMTQIFDEDGLVIPVTVVDCGPLTVVDVKTADRDGYAAVKVGYEDIGTRKLNRPDKGQFAKAGLDEKKHLREFRTDASYEVGQEINVADMFAVGDKIDVTGISKGKGFAGAIKRHNYRTGPATHGSRYHRGPGSLGASATPGRVWKGKKLPGQMGNQRVTVQNLEVVVVDADRNFIAIKGAIPGPKGGRVLEIKNSVKSVK